MSIKLMSAIWDNESLSLDCIDTAILLKMADHAADDGTQIFPSYEYLSKKVKLHKRIVIKRVQSLLERNIIILVEKGDSSGKSNKYRLNIDLIIPAVDKSVHNPVKKKERSDPRSLGGSDPRSLDVVIHDHPNHHSLTITNNHHMIGDQKDDFLKNEIIDELLEMKVSQKHIPGWIREIGIHPLNHLIQSMKEQQNRTGIKIANPGGYIRALVNQRLGRAPKRLGLNMARF